ncbi:MAG: response regulator transcription factor [Orrella sp.]
MSKTHHVTKTHNEPVLRILVVEDNADLREVLVEALSFEGYSVRGLDSAEAFAETASNFVFDLLIVDLNLPGENGLSFTQRMREQYPDLGVIMVTARNLVADKTAGYDCGADIYMTKPVSLQEMKAAIRSLSKRLLANAAQATVTLDRPTGCLLGLSGEVVRLSATEISILSALAFAPENKLEAWQIMEAIKRDPLVYTKSALEIVLVRLRKRMREAGLPETSLRSVRGWGYQLNHPLRLR